jgi:hypothetical protein
MNHRTARIVTANARLTIKISKMLGPGSACRASVAVSTIRLCSFLTTEPSYDLRRPTAANFIRSPPTGSQSSRSIPLKPANYVATRGQQARPKSCEPRQCQQLRLYDPEKSLDHKKTANVGNYDHGRACMIHCLLPATATATNFSGSIELVGTASKASDCSTECRKPDGDIVTETGRIATHRTDGSFGRSSD